MSTNTIDLSLVPMPDAVEELDQEVIFSQWLQSLLDKDPAYTGLVESDPAYIQGEALSYRELLLRQRINEGVKATFLAHANGADLDSKAADYGVVRLIIDPGDPASVPPRDPVKESDEALRARTWLSMQALSTAGPYGAYKYHALSASPAVLDARAYGPEDHGKPGEVHVYILSRTGDGTPDQALLDVVTAALGDDVRPLTDYVKVFAATIIPYAIDAVLHIKSGPDPQSVLDTARKAVEVYVDSVRRIEQTVAESGLHQAQHQSGVERVAMRGPVGDLLGERGAAYHCTSITLSIALGEDE